MMTALLSAQAARRDRAEKDVLLAVGALVDDLCDSVELDVAVPNYKLVGPDKRKKLSGLINHYRKMAHPFTACVRDNTARFGSADRAKRVCAVLTDLEKGTTHWRKGGKKKSSLSLSELSETAPVIDQEMFDFLFAISKTNYRSLLQLDAAAGETAPQAQEDKT